ncbi:signal peptidase I [Prochlorococcus marinus]|uniref:Signal peptidase I n=1 Tax=Prochlorococcus marinus (strain MIT 9211) TaxID=93059 RepID=A9BAW3_PROM4|nr:signal peptidase I [Prochlorococcus marinus]ABX08975.1 leader peptidase I [Prochlorococcus marinus str. MIT 9211]
MTSPREKKPNQKKNSWTGIIIWILIAIFLRWQVIEPRWIPSGSMLPTLNIQDRILVEKLSPKIKKFKNPSAMRNAIVVFNPPQQLIDAGYESNAALIKRIVGIPGDKIEVNSGKLIRNGETVKETWLSEPIGYEMKKIIVPPHSFWVLGDNRNNSLDSHLWGELPEENLIGTALVRYWPINNIGSIRFSPSTNVVS